MVSIDETQVNRGFKTTFGWSKKGENSVNVNERLGGHPIHILAAITSTRVIGYQLRYQVVKGYSFKYFLQHLIREIKKMDPHNYKEKFFIFMDNASPHKIKFVKDFIEVTGIPFLCNAPMTPHLQPIEFLFSLLKREFGKYRHLNYEGSLVHLFYCWKAVADNPAKIYNTYVHCLRSYKDILHYENVSRGKRSYKFELISTTQYREKPPCYTAMIRFLTSTREDKKMKTKKEEVDHE
jgi:transposase